MYSQSLASNFTIYETDQYQIKRDPSWEQIFGDRILYYIAEIPGCPWTSQGALKRPLGPTRKNSLPYPTPPYQLGNNELGNNELGRHFRKSAQATCVGINKKNREDKRELEEHEVRNDLY